MNSNGYHYKVNRAYVGIPSDIERGQYIKDCCLNMWISIMTEDGGFMNRVPVPPEVLSFIDFPLTANELGSPVLYVTEDMSNNPFVIARYQKQEDLGDHKEAQFKFRRVYNDRVVEIVGSPKDNVLNFTIIGGSRGGQLNINLHSTNGDSQLNVNVSGSGTFTFQNELQHKAVGRTVFQTYDTKFIGQSSLEQFSDNHRFINKKFNINDGKENFLLGQKWSQFMNDLLDEISSSTVSTSIGEQPLVNAIKIANFKQRIKDVLSSVGFIDK